MQAAHMLLQYFQKGHILIAPEEKVFFWGN